MSEPRDTSLGECYYTSEDSEGWCYARHPFLEGDHRALVSLCDTHGMAWVGIRVWSAQRRAWFNGNEPELNNVLAWQPIPQTARRHWYRGQLITEAARGRVCKGTTSEDDDALAQHGK